jgi:hypothetical protein
MEIEEEREKKRKIKIQLAQNPKGLHHTRHPGM